MNKRILFVIALVGIFFVQGCGLFGESEQEKYYRRANESQKKAEEMNKKAADSLKKMGEEAEQYKPIKIK